MRIEFEATFGHERKQVEITWPHGAAGQVMVMVDRYFWGQFVSHGGTWMGYSNSNSFSADDITAIGEIIEEEFRAKSC